MTDNKTEPTDETKKLKLSDPLEPLDETQIPPMTEVDDDPRIPYIIESLRHVYDPEIPVNVYELGLIYEIRVRENDKQIHIEMTLTSPHCPVAEEIPLWIISAAKKVEGVDDVSINITWDPPWNPSLMSDTAKYHLNMF